MLLPLTCSARCCAIGARSDPAVRMSEMPYGGGILRRSSRSRRWAPAPGDRGPAVVGGAGAARDGWSLETGRRPARARRAPSRRDDPLRGASSAIGEALRTARSRASLSRDRRPPPAPARRGARELRAALSGRARCHCACCDSSSAPSGRDQQSHIAISLARSRRSADSGNSRSASTEQLDQKHARSVIASLRRCSLSSPDQNTMMSPAT